MKKDKTNLIFITVIILIISFTVFLFYFFRIIKTENQYTREIEAVISRKINDNKNAEILTKKSSELKLINNKINGYFIDPVKINLFVDYLENLGFTNNSKLIVKNVEIPKSETDVIGVKVNIRGNFNNVMKIFYLLENSPFYINIKEVFINKDIEKIEIESTDTNKEVWPVGWQADISFNVLKLPK